MLNPNDNAPDIMNCDTTTSPEELNWAPDMMDCDITTSSEEPNWEETWAALETGSTQVLTKNLSLSTQVAIQAFWYWFKGNVHVMHPPCAHRPNAKTPC
jgi:hypothetical protein